MTPSLKPVARRWKLLGSVAAFQVVLAGLFSLPISRALDASSLPELPHATRRLLEPGGLFLVEWLRLEGGHMSGALGASLWLSLFTSWAILVPVALVLAALSDPRRLSYQRHGRQVFQTLPSLTLVWGLTLLARALAVLLLFVSWQALSSVVATRHQFALLASSAALIAVTWCLLGLWQDLARAAIVARRRRAFSALAAGYRTLRQSPLQVARAYLGWLVLSALLTLALLLSVRLSLAVRPGPVWLAFAAQQLGIALWWALRAAWSQSALGLALSSCGPAPVDTRVGSDEPADPSPSLGA